MDDALEVAVEAAAKSAKSAKRATVLMLLAVAVAVAVLALDNSIKQQILNEAQNARNLFEELKQTIAATRKEVKGGTEATVKADGPGGADLNGSSDVLHDPGAGADVAAPAVPAKRAPARKSAGTRRGPRRDG